MLAVGGEPVHPGVAVAVGDVQETVRRDGDVAGAVERPGRPDDRVAVVPRPAGVRWLVPLAHGHQQVALGVVLEDHVAVLDRQVEVLIVVDEHAVGVGEHALAPGGEIVAVPVQDDQRDVRHG